MIDDSTKTKNINDEAYTNYAIYMRLDNYIKSREEKDEILCGKIEEIIKAQKYTNGNVMDLLLWRAYVKGQIWVIPIFIAAIISGGVGLLFKFII